MYLLLRPIAKHMLSKLQSNDEINPNLDISFVIMKEGRDAIASKLSNSLMTTSLLSWDKEIVDALLSRCTPFP